MATSTPSIQMKQVGSAGRKALILFVNKFLGSAIQIPIIIFLSRTFGPAVVGEYAFAQAIVIPMMFFVSLRFSAVILTDTRRQRGHADYFVISSLLCLAISSVVGLVLWSAGHGSLLPVFFALVVFRCFYLFSEFVVAFAQKAQDFDFILRSSSIRFTALLLTFVLVAQATQSLFWGLAAIASCQIVLTLVLELPWMFTNREGLSRPDTRSIKPWLGRRALFLHAIPLGFAVLFANLTPNTVRYLIVEMMGIDQLGYYAAVMQFVVVLRMAVAGASNSVLPRQARMFDARDARGFVTPFLVLVSGLVAMGLVGAAASLAFGDFLLWLVYGPEFVGQKQLLAATAGLASFIFMAQISEASALAARITRASMYVNAVTLLLAMVSAFVLIPVFGLLGVQLALGISALFQSAIFWTLIIRKW
ncbi:MAG: oligosaccharide flippase family protein [Pseudomonadota bacterium]